MQDVHQELDRLRRLRLEQEDQPELEYSDGGVYKGEVDEHDNRHGFGLQQCPDGSWYLGEWASDIRSGRGKCVLQHSDGNTLTYEGTWKADMMHGRGTLWLPDGSIHSGSFREDTLHGFARVYRFNGDVLKGQFAHNVLARGVKQGADGTYEEGIYDCESGVLTVGKVVSADSCVTYVGEFHEQKPDGFGKLTVLRKDGSFLRASCGKFQSGKMHGHGKCEWVDDEHSVGEHFVYSGEWSNDQMHGYGRLSWRTGNCEGEFRDGAASGLCVHVDKTAGERYEGEMTSGIRSGFGSLMVPGSKHIDGYFCSHSCQKLPDRTAFISTKESQYYGDIDCLHSPPCAHGFGTMCFAHGGRKVFFRGEFDSGKWIQSSAEPTLCRVHGKLQAIAGRSTRLRLEARDELGNIRLSGGERFEIAVSGNGSTAHVEDGDNGWHMLDLRFKEAGWQTLTVKLDGEHVGDSPYPIAVSPAEPDAKRSDAIIKQAEDESCIITHVYGRDKFRNRCSPDLLKPQVHVSCSHLNIVATTYTGEDGARCDLPHECLYTVHVTARGSQCGISIGDTPKPISNRSENSETAERRNLMSFAEHYSFGQQSSDDEEDVISEQERLAREKPETPLVSRLEDLHLLSAYKQRYTSS
jgi:hypothetical protein